jgi:cell wall-associated NlpC family hydrolase
MSKSDRLRLLELADPANFPRTRYREGPRYGIEKETDCSHFVHEIYRRAGLRFGFQTTKNLKRAPEFELLPESAAKPGDLMLFRGHVGIVDEDGKIISATRNRRHRKSSITRMSRSAFRPYRGARPVLRYRCHEPVRRLAQER